MEQRLAQNWPWTAGITTAITSLQTPVRLTSGATTTTRKENTRPVERRPPDATAERPGTTEAENQRQAVASDHHAMVTKDRG